MNQDAINLGVVLLASGLLAVVIALVRTNRRLREEHQRAEESIQRLGEAESRFRAIFENVDALSIQGYQSDGTVVYWNRASEKIYGYSPQEAIGGSLFDLIIPPPMREDVRGAVQWMFENRQGIPASRLDLQHKDGHIVPVYSSHTVVETALHGATMFCLDIDLRELASTERALIESEGRQSTLLDAIGEGVYGVGRDGVCTFINPAAQAMLGWSEQEILGHDVHSLFHHHLPDGHHYPQADCPIYKTIGDGQTRRIDEWFWRKDGTGFPVKLTVTPQFQSGEPAGAVAVFTDITDSVRTARELEKHRHHLEELVEQRTRQLAEARQVAELASEAKSRFLANMSHEIRTPMNAILGMAHLIRRDEIPPRQLERLDKIDRAAEHLLSVINDILDLSKIEAGKLKLDEAEVDIPATLNKVIDILGERARNKGLTIEIDCADFPETLLGDPTRIAQSLINYTGNAIKFTEHGQITLRAERLRNVDDAVEVRFEVEDTGIGISETALTQLFNAFEQADNSTTRKYGGTGLGLSITKRLAELMGGSAGADSRLGRGSVFWFTVLLKTSRAVLDNAQEASDGHLSDDGMDISGYRILIVEDEAINQEIACEFLADQGLSITTANNGLEAVALATREHFDLILMDMHMPEMDGLEATRRIRQLEAYGGVPIIAMTANAFAEDKVQCMAVGMNDFVSKPVEPRQMLNTVKRWLAAAERNAQST